MDHHVLLTITIGIIGLSLVLTPVAAEDMADNCEEAEVLEDGTYGDRITPNDQDVFLLELDEGDYITARLSWDHSVTERIRVRHLQADTELFSPIDGTITQSNDDGEYVNFRSRWGTLNVFSPYHDPNNPQADGEVEIELTALGDEGQSCIAIETGADDQSHWWNISFSTNQPTVEFGPGGAEDTERIQDLEQRLEAKNETIQQLEERIVELETQLNASGGQENGGEEIVIDVTVEPGNDQQSFVKDGEAVITAESTNADVSNVEIDFANNVYTLDESGTAVIPLTVTGPQEFIFSYQEVTERVSITVDEADQDGLSENEQTTGSSDGGGNIIPVEGPGFGPVSVVIAVLVLVVITLVRQRNRQ
jgi:hypothetical protein